MLITFGVVDKFEGVVFEGHEAIKNGVYGFVGELFVSDRVVHVIGTHMVSGFGQTSDG